MECKIAIPARMKSIVVWNCLIVKLLKANGMITISERKDYAIDGKLISSRELIEDINIGDISQESVSVLNQSGLYKVSFTVFISTSVQSSAVKWIVSSA